MEVILGTDTEREIWKFALDFNKKPLELHLNSWTREKRESTRHKWRAVLSTNSFEVGLQREIVAKPTPPESLLLEIRKQLAESVSKAVFAPNDGG